MSSKKKHPIPSITPIAVIDIGTSSVRMVIAQMTHSGKVQTLESLQQTVALGKDTFTTGRISMEATEACVKVLRSFRSILHEYHITDDDHIRAVATTAVREASNKNAFLDRIFIATGLRVESLDEAEGNQYTYLSVLPLLQEYAPLKKNDTLVVEVGGGSTELLLVKKQQVAHSQTYRLGSLRLREILEKVQKSKPKLSQLMNTQIQLTMQQIQHDLDFPEGLRFLALGGDARFAAQQLVPNWDLHSPVKIDVPDVKKLSKKLLTMSVEDIARIHHLDFASAESIGPALLIYTRLAEALGVGKMIVTGSSVRDGILAEMVAQSSHIDEFSHQIIHSALELGKKYHFDKKHAEYVAELSLFLFDFMSDSLYLSSRYKIILRVAALLHEIGRQVNERAHHKHSMYLILNSEIFGLSSKDRTIVALLARYHRKAIPRDGQDVYSELSHDDRIVVSKLAAILRVADAISRSRLHKIEKIQLSMEPGLLMVTIGNTADLSLEQLAMTQKGQLFMQVFGRRVLVRTGKTGNQRDNRKR